jgi:hypothetical protein
MSNLVSHAKRELELAGLFGKNDFYDGYTGKAVLELVEVFAKQGHSGMSAPLTIKLFKELADFKPINPITGNDDEWEEVGDNTYQNNRLSSVFKKGKEGRPYFLDAIVWREENGFAFCGTVDGITSRQYIRLPFLPKTFFINVDSERNIIDRSQLDEVFEYYDRYEA